MPAVEGFIANVPKLDLHLHLVGSASPATVLPLARRSPELGVPTDETGLRELFVFRNFFPHFIEVYSKVSSLVRDGGDVAALVAGLGRDLAVQKGRYAEVTVTPYSFTMRGMPYQEMVAGLASGRSYARSLGVELAWCYDFPGELGLSAADATLSYALDDPPEGLVSFGLGGAEAGVDRRLFRDHFSQAKGAGLHSVPHAGEGDGPASVWAALDDLGADRIGHGVRSVEDPNLVRELADRKVPLEVCPTSNVCTRVFPTLAEHSLPRLLEAGVTVTINTDDPPMFSTDLSTEYLAVATTFGFGVSELAALVRNGVRASFLPADAKSAFLVDVDAAETAA